MKRVTFGGLLAFALLGLFVYAVVLALIVANNCTRTCSLNEGTAALLEAIGALVSAVVISELSVTKPNEVPGTRLAAAWTTEKQKTGCESIGIYLHCGMARYWAGFSHLRLGSETHSSSIS